jgi:hypothetical protein
LLYVVANNPEEIALIESIQKPKNVQALSDYIWSQAWNWKITQAELTKKLSA